MAFSRGCFCYDSRAYKAFLATLTQTVKHPLPASFLPNTSTTCCSREWTVRNPTQTHAARIALNYSRWYARFWLAVNAFGDSRGAHRGVRPHVSRSDPFVSDPHDDSDLFRCPRAREFIDFDTGVAVTTLVYDRIVCVNIGDQIWCGIKCFNIKEIFLIETKNHLILIIFSIILHLFFLYFLYYIFLYIFILFFLY